MENLQLIEFLQLNPHLYKCKTCGTHIALAEDFIFHHIPEPDVTGGVFNKVVNVHAEDEPRRLKRVASHIFADVYCNRCNSVLGIKYVEAEKFQTLIKNGMVQLNMKRLVMRHGNDFFDGETMVLLPPPDHYICRKCRTYVALVEDICNYIFEIADQSRVSRILSKRVVNVGIVPDASLLQKVGPYTFAGVYCANCNLCLGWKMIASDCGSFTAMVQAELVEFYVKALLRSHGNNIVPAETMIPPYP